MSGGSIWAKGLRCEGCAVLHQPLSATLPKPLPPAGGVGEGASKASLSHLKPSPGPSRKREGSKRVGVEDGG
jgi:hypothetical protein